MNLLQLRYLCVSVLQSIGQSQSFNRFFHFMHPMVTDTLPHGKSRANLRAYGTFIFFQTEQMPEQGFL